MRVFARSHDVCDNVSLGFGCFESLCGCWSRDDVFLLVFVAKLPPGRVVPALSASATTDVRLDQQDAKHFLRELAEQLDTQNPPFAHILLCEAMRIR